MLQKIKKQKPRSKPFTVEALDDFIHLSKFLRRNEFNELLISFYNKWGPFIKLGENYKTTKKLFQLLEDSEFAKQNMEYPPYDFGSDLFSKNYPKRAFAVYGKLVFGPSSFFWHLKLPLKNRYY